MNGVFLHNISATIASFVAILQFIILSTSWSQMMVQLLSWYNRGASSLHSLDTASVQEYGGHVGVVQNKDHSSSTSTMDSNATLLYDDTERRHLLYM